jgi:hypothetical protein
MGTGAPHKLRVPLIVLAAVNLVVLSIRLWPWQEVANLPGNGATGYDPALCLLACIGLIFWIGSTEDESFKKALSAGAKLGLLAGLMLVAQVVLVARLASHSRLLETGLLGTAGILWGVAGLYGSRTSGNIGVGAVSGLWSAIVSCLMACSAVLAEMYLAGPPPTPQDPWLQYQDLAIGNPAAQALVHSLNTATEFLLIGPLLGFAVGLVFSFFGQSQEAEPGQFAK